MGTMASQITRLTIVYSTVYSGADQRKHQSYASLAFVRGIHRWPVNSPHKWPVTRKTLPFDADIPMEIYMIHKIYVPTHSATKWHFQYTAFKGTYIYFICNTHAILSSETHFPHVWLCYLTWIYVGSRLMQVYHINFIWNSRCTVWLKSSTAIWNGRKKEARGAETSLHERVDHIV